MSFLFKIEEDIRLFHLKKVTLTLQVGIIISLIFCYTSCRYIDVKEIDVETMNCKVYLRTRNRYSTLSISVSFYLCLRFIPYTDNIFILTAHFANFSIFEIRRPLEKLLLPRYYLFSHVEKSPLLSTLSSLFLSPRPNNGKLEGRTTPPWLCLRVPGTYFFFFLFFYFLIPFLFLFLSFFIFIYLF